MEKDSTIIFYNIFQSGHNELFVKPYNLPAMNPVGHICVTNLTITYMKKVSYSYLNSHSPTSHYIQQF